MTSFSIKEISNPLSLGERIKNRREELGISLSEAAKTTSISIKYLQAIESGFYNELPGEIYAKNFLKVYTKFLGLNSVDFFSLYKSERKIYDKTRKGAVPDHKKPVSRISSVHLVVTPKIVRGIIIGLLAVVCLIYLGVKIKAIITPPILLVNSPVDNFVTEQNFVDVIGQTEPESTLDINGQQILADGNGNFKETIDLQLGVNIIEISAKKRHSDQTKVYRQVILVDKGFVAE